MTEGKMDIVCLCEYAGRVCCTISTVALYSTAPTAPSRT
jgi:hypothetical protein